MTLAFRDTADAIEAAVDDERELRRLLRELERDDRLDAEERTFLGRRVAFYLDDSHARRREAERIARGELDAAEPQ